MTDSVIVTEVAIRTLIKELLANDCPAVVTEPPVHDPYVPIEPRPEVDTTYRAYDNMYAIPVGTDMSPKNKEELEAAIKVFLQDLPDVAVGRAFTKIEQAIEDAAEESGATEELSMKTADHLNLSKAQHIEAESIKRAVRALLKEVDGEEEKLDLPSVGDLKRDAAADVALPKKFKPKPKKTFDELKADLQRLFAKIKDPKDSVEFRRKREMNLADQTDKTKLTYPEFKKKEAELKKLYKAATTPEEKEALEKEYAALSTREMSYKEMAPELGFAGETGAKRIDWLTLQKSKFLAGLSPDVQDALFSKARNGYIMFLRKSGELTPEEIKALEDHPDAVHELDGFREWLAPYVRDAQEAQESGLENDNKWAQKQWKSAMQLVKKAHSSAAHHFKEEEEEEEEEAKSAEDAEDEFGS